MKKQTRAIVRRVKKKKKTRRIETAASEAMALASRAIERCGELEAQIECIERNETRLIEVARAHRMLDLEKTVFGHGLSKVEYEKSFVGVRDRLATLESRLQSMVEWVEHQRHSPYVPR